MVAAVAPFALPALVVVLGAFWFLYIYFQNCARQIKRLDAVSRQAPCLLPAASLRRPLHPRLAGSTQSC
jgi:hypothetical protein